MISINLLRSFRKNLKALKLAKKQYEVELLNLRAEIYEYERAIEYAERNIRRVKNAAIRTKKQSRYSK